MLRHRWLLMAGVTTGALGLMGVLMLPKIITPERLPSQVSRCSPDALAVADTIDQPIHPIQLTVAPWRGRHHVYSIFAVPEVHPAQTQPPKEFIVTLDELGTYCGVAHDVGRYHQNLEAKSGQRLMKGYFRTRTTWWVTLKGGLWQLRRPDNWTILPGTKRNLGKSFSSQPRAVDTRG